MKKLITVNLALLISVLTLVISSCGSSDEPIHTDPEDVELDDSEFSFTEDISTLFSGATIEKAYLTYTSLGFGGRTLHYDIDKYGFSSKSYYIGYKAFNSISEIDTIPSLYNSYNLVFPKGIDWQKQTLIIVGVEYNKFLSGNADGFSVYQKDGKFKIYINVLPIPGIYDMAGHSCHFVVINQPGVKTSHIRSFGLPLLSAISYYENR